MRSVKTYSLQFVLVACALIAVIFLAYRFWGEYPRELAAVEAHQQRELTSLRQGLQQNREHLLATVRDWAHWDDTYDFVRAPAAHEDYVESNILGETFHLFNLVGIGYYDVDLNPILRRGFDLDAYTWAPFEKVLPQDLANIIGSATDGEQKKSLTGWTLTDQGPAEFALEYITTSDEESAPAGYLLFVRLISQRQLDDLQAITRLEIAMRAAGPADTVATVPPLGNSELVEGFQTARNRLLTDPANAPVAVLSIEHDPIATPRAIGAEQLFLLMGLMMVPVLTLTVTDRVLVRPLRRNANRIESMVHSQALKFLPQEAPVYELEQIRGAFNRLVEQVQTQQTYLTELSLTDALTGIPNRRAFDWTADNLWRQAMRLHESFLCVLLDIDYFKEFNDALGHPEGDQALRNVADMLVSFSRRSGDFCARLGGEEFALVVLGLSESDARNWIEKLCASVEALSIAHPGSRVSPVLTVSAGVLYIASPGVDSAATSVADLLREADQALYDAKRAGRNRFTFLVLEDHAHSS